MQGAGKLTQKQEQFIVALMSSPTLEAAAKQTGINPVTAWRWMKLPAFQAAYLASKRDLVQHSITLLQKFSTTAVSTLAQVMTDAKAPASSRVAAAKVVLEMALRGVELEDLAVRIHALEEQADGARP